MPSAMIPVLRSGRACRVTALALATALAAPAARAGSPPDASRPSGLGWASGATVDDFPCLADLRGRALDASHTFLTDTTFDGMVRQSAGWLQREAKRAPLWVVSMGLLPSGSKGQFAQCAAGAFDPAYRLIGANLQKAGAQGTIVLPGWEANLGSHSHPWGVDHASQVPAYLGCWRRAAAALKQGRPAIRVEFNSAKVTRNPEFKSLDLYPGDDVVDGWSLQYYDNAPVKSTQALWDKFYNLTYRGDVFGLGTWLAAAQAHGKKLGLAEWGVWQLPGMTPQAADDPVFVDNMYRFFRDNAAAISYETYFDADVANGAHALCHTDGTPTRFPNAAAAYARDWGSASAARRR